MKKRFKKLDLYFYKFKRNCFTFEIIKGEYPEIRIAFFKCRFCITTLPF